MNAWLEFLDLAFSEILLFIAIFVMVDILWPKKGSDK